MFNTDDYIDYIIRSPFHLDLVVGGVGVEHLLDEGPEGGDEVGVSKHFEAVADQLGRKRGTSAIKHRILPPPHRQGHTGRVSRLLRYP